MVIDKKSAKSKIFSVIRTVLLACFALVQLFPLIWLLDFSLAESSQLFGENVLVALNPPHWENYYKAIFQSHFFLYLRNSVLVNGLAIFFVLLFSVMAAFACTRMQWKLRSTVYLILLLGLMIPSYSALLPNFLVFTKLKLTNTIWALLLPYVAFPFSTGFLLTSGYMESLPRSLEESALIDGCGVYRMLFQIIVPLMKSSLTTVAIITYLTNWNEFLTAMTYLSKHTWKTLPFLVLEFTGQYSSDYAVQFATMALAAIPALIVYIAMNKSIVKGVAAGAIKG